MQGLETQVNYTDNPVAWFVILEQARQGNNFELAAKAKRELKRLGINVNYPKRNANKRLEIEQRNNKDTGEAG